jgi:hypothetical protein
MMIRLVGRQVSANDSIDQLVEQLIAYRAELQEARAEYAAKIAQAKAHFDEEAAAMRRELEEALAELRMLDAFTKLRRGESETLN